MPLTYNADKTKLTWKYETDHNLHKIHWDTHPDFNNPSSIT